MDRGEPLTLRAEAGYRPLCDKTSTSARSVGGHLSGKEGSASHASGC